MASPAVPAFPRESELALSALKPVEDQFQIDEHKATLVEQGGQFLQALAARQNEHPTAAAAKLSVDDLLSYSSEVLKQPLLKHEDSEMQKRSTQLFTYVLLYMREPGRLAPSNIGVDAARVILDRLVRHPTLRNEVYMQILKQTRRNSVVASCCRAWELLGLACSTAPPSGAFKAIVDEHINANADAAFSNPFVTALAEHARTCLRRTSRSGPRQWAPTIAEVKAALRGSTPKTVVLLVDGSKHELLFRINTTVQDAVKQLVEGLSLQCCDTVGLFAVKPHLHRQPGNSAQSGTAGGRRVDGARYVADVLAEIREACDGEELAFKKYMFLPRDVRLEPPACLALTYAQAREDYLAGLYPPARPDESCALCALQLHAAGIMDCDAEGMLPRLPRFIPQEELAGSSRGQWAAAVAAQYKELRHVVDSPDTARLKFLQHMDEWPCGLASFFSLDLLECPKLLPSLPRHLILGVNRRGAHFLQTPQTELLYSANLRDVKQFWAENRELNVTIRMRKEGKVVGVQLFKFGTNHGKHICFVLQSYMNDALRQRYIQARAAANTVFTVEVPHADGLASHANPAYDSTALASDEPVAVPVEQSDDEDSEVQRVLCEVRQLLSEDGELQMQLPPVQLPPMHPNSTPVPPLPESYSPVAHLKTWSASSGSSFGADTTPGGTPLGTPTGPPSGNSSPTEESK